MTFKGIGLIGIFTVSVFTLFYCSKNDRTALSNSRADCEGTVDVSKWRNEIIWLDSMRIDDTLEYLSPVESIISILGGEDHRSLIPASMTYITYLVSDTTKWAKLLFVEGFVFESMDNFAVPISIDFRKSNTVVDFSGVKLYKDMWVGEICELYPESCKLILIGGNLWSGHIEVRASNIAQDPRRVVLIFRNEKLVKLEAVTYTRG